MMVTDDDEGNGLGGRGCSGSGVGDDDDGVIGGKLFKQKD